MPDNEQETQERSAAANYAFARAFAVGLNALIVGLIATAFFAIALLWLQKSSGIRLEKSQYGGVLLFIFVLITLCAYLVCDYIQSRKEEDAKRRRAANKPAAKGSEKIRDDDWGAILEARLKEFDPLFAENEDQSAPAPHPVKQVAAAGAQASATIAPAVAAAVSAPAPAPAKDLTAILFAQAVTAAVAALEDRPTLFAQFGVNLFLAGASSEIAARSRLAPAQGRQILESMLAETGMSKRSAGIFAANASTFAQVPHFRAPIEAGFRAMAAFAQTGMADASALSEMLVQWQIQDGIVHAPEVMTFVTTSVGVPPPGITIQPEDQQRVLRAHATVITEVLHRFQGREIHNLGNGRIIVFDDATRAIRAAAQIMESLDRFARANPTLIVVPRIGVDTDMGAIVAHNYVSAALPRTVTLATIASANCICCTEAAKDDATDIIEFQPVSLSDIYSDLPPLFAAAWSQAPVDTSNAAPLEYRQVGARPIKPG
ncbi:MAG: hypothetical protein AB7I36_03420 [Rhodospirillaceae bacterium]